MSQRLGPRNAACASQSSLSSFLSSSASLAFTDFPATRRALARSLRARARHRQPLAPALHYRDVATDNNAHGAQHSGVGVGLRGSLSSQGHRASGCDARFVGGLFYTNSSHSLSVRNTYRLINIVIIYRISRYTYNIFTAY